MAKLQAKSTKIGCLLYYCLPYQRKRYTNTYLSTVRTAKLWNSLPESLFPENYNLSAFKASESVFTRPRHVIYYSYADMVLLRPSVCALRDLLRTCEAYANLNISNYLKSEVMIFVVRGMSLGPTPPITLYGKQLPIVERFKDYCDIERERRALAVRENMLARRFVHCSAEVKRTLFKAACGLAILTQRAISALRVLYNNMFRVFLGLPRFCSASGMFADARVDGFHAIMRKKKASIRSRIKSSPNGILSKAY